MNLPYELSQDATAYKNGIAIRFAAMWALPDSFPGRPKAVTDKGLLFAWAKITPYLRYRKGEPWCWYWPEFDRVALEPSSEELLDDEIAALHRRATILCDHTHAFIVLYKCVERYGNAQP